MNRRGWLLTAGALAACAALFGLWPKKPVPAREQVEQRCIQLLHAAEARNVPAMMALVSDRFAGSDAANKLELQGLLTHQLAQQSWVRIFMTGLSVELPQPHQAIAHARFVFGRSAAQSLHDLTRDSVLEAYAVDAAFVEEDGQWRVAGETHRSLSPDEVLQPE